MVLRNSGTRHSRIRCCGYADFMVAPTEPIASIPDELSATDATPLMCAGITIYNALLSSGARVSDVVAILGIGGLGH